MENKTFRCEKCFNLYNTDKEDNFIYYCDNCERLFKDSLKERIKLNWKYPFMDLPF